MEDLPGKHWDLPRKIGDVVDLPLGKHTKMWKTRGETRSENDLLHS